MCLPNLQTTNLKEKNMKKNRSRKVFDSSAGRNLARVVLMAVATLVATGAAFAQDNAELKFKGGIGVIPVTGVAANGAINLNVVRGVAPGAPWRIASLEAQVTSDGHLKVVGRGLLLATGNGI